MGKRSCPNSSVSSAWYARLLRAFITRTMAASTWYWRSAATRSCVASTSARVSFIWIVLILMRMSAALKSDA